MAFPYSNPYAYSFAYPYAYPQRHPHSYPQPPLFAQPSYFSQSSPSVHPPPPLFNSRHPHPRFTPQPPFLDPNSSLPSPFPNPNCPLPPPPLPPNIHQTRSHHTEQRMDPQYYRQHHGLPYPSGTGLDGSNDDGDRSGRGLDWNHEGGIPYPLHSPSSAFPFSLPHPPHRSSYHMRGNYDGDHNHLSLSSTTSSSSSAVFNNTIHPNDQGVFGDRAGAGINLNYFEFEHEGEEQEEEEEEEEEKEEEVFYYAHVHPNNLTQTQRLNYRERQRQRQRQSGGRENGRSRGNQDPPCFPQPQSVHTRTAAQERDFVSSPPLSQRCKTISPSLASSASGRQASPKQPRKEMS